MNIRIFNLSHNVNDTDLRKMFSTYGTVTSAEVARNKHNGRSNGIALVEMPIEHEARQAIFSLDKKELGGKIISVMEVDSFR